MSLENLSPEDITRLAAVSYQLLDNPETRKEVMRLQKKINPNTVFPELEVDDRIAKASLASEERIQKLEQEIQKRDLQTLRSEKHQMLMDKGLASSREEIDHIEKFAIDNSIPDYEKAAKFYRLEQQTAEPTYDNSSAKPPVPPMLDLKAAGGNLDRWARNTAFDAITEFRKQAATH